MHLEDKVVPANNVPDVIGRAPDAPHKFFYRCHAHSMWTPWEQVNAETQGNHLAPMIWRDRLHFSG